MFEQLKLEKCVTLPGKGHLKWTTLSDTGAKFLLNKYMFNFLIYVINSEYNAIVFPIIKIS